MTSDASLERTIVGVMAGDAVGNAPEQAIELILSTTRGVQPDARWLAFLWEPPMQIPSRVAVGSPKLRLVAILAAVTVLTLAVVGAIGVGASGLWRPSPAVGPGLRATATFVDRQDDLQVRDPGLEPSSGLPFIDITRFEAVADGTDVHLTMTLAGNVPDPTTLGEQELGYAFFFSTGNADDGHSGQLLIASFKGRWMAHYLPGTGPSAQGDDYPWPFDVAGDMVTIAVPLAAIGSPSATRILAHAYLDDQAAIDPTYGGPGFVGASDAAPDGDIFVPSDLWLVLGQPVVP